jgi:hypothetical protein
VSTYRVLAGALMFLVWNAGLSVFAATRGGWLAGLLTFVGLPVLGAAGLRCIDNASWTFKTARRWLLLRRGDPRITALRDRQIELASRLDDALAANTSPP